MADQRPEDQRPADDAAESQPGDAPRGEGSGAPQPESDGSNPHSGGATSAGAEAEQAMADVEHATGEVAAAAAGEAASYDLPTFEKNGSTEEPAGLGLLRDVNLSVKIELGRTRMYVEDVLRLNEDSVVELDKAAGDPVDIFVNGRLVARGEVLVLNENFCVRISEIVSNQPGDRQ